MLRYERHTAVDLIVIVVSVQLSIANYLLPPGTVSRGLATANAYRQEVSNTLYEVLRPKQP